MHAMALYVIPPPAASTIFSLKSMLYGLISITIPRAIGNVKHFYYIYKIDSYAYADSRVFVAAALAAGFDGVI